MANNILRYPLPLLGLNTVNPYIEHDSGYAREFTNYALVDGRPFMRPGVYIRAFDASLPAISATPFWWFDPGSGTYDSILGDGSLRNADTGAIIGGLGAGTFLYHDMPTEVTFSGAATTLNMVIGVRRAAAPNQPLLRTAPFTAIGPTAPLGVPYCGCSHKGRLYYANNTYTIEWGNVGQVAGAFPAANTISVEQFMNGQSISRMFSVSLSPGLSPTQNVFVVFGKEGRVLVFEGDNPGSATWNLIGAYDMPAPISRRGFVEIDGDIFVSTNKYAYWFRDLFSGGAQSAYANSPSVPIENLWQAVSWTALFAEASHSFYVPKLDAIVVQCSEKNTTEAKLSSVFEYANEGVYFVYFRKYKAWALWAMTPMFAPAITSGGNVYATGYYPYISGLGSIPGGALDYYVALDGTWQALTIDVECSWKTPYAFLEKGIGLRLNSARAWVDLNHSNSYAVINKSRALFDYSDLNAPWGFYTQNMVTQINPGRYTETRTTVIKNAYAQYQPLLQLGGDGSGLSLQTTFQGQIPDPGFSEDFKYSIYGISALVQPASEIF